jgi:hypothetical protein
MFVVGIARLAGALQDELTALAADLGMTAYDARMLLAPGIPALVLVTPDKSKALGLLGSLRARGHEALAFDTQAVVSSQAMVSPRQLAVRTDRFEASLPEPVQLVFSDILALIRGTHETRVDATVATTKRKFSAGRAALSGGLVMTKKETNTSSSHVYDKQDVLYIYLRSGGRPWLLRERGTRYDGLGDRMAPTERANFLTVVDILRQGATQAVYRQGAPQAVYDESLIGRKIPERLTQIAVQGMGSGSTRVESSTDAAMDLLCHFVAMWYAKQKA